MIHPHSFHLYKVFSKPSGYSASHATKNLKTPILYTWHVHRELWGLISSSAAQACVQTWPLPRTTRPTSSLPFYFLVLCSSLLGDIREACHVASDALLCGLAVHLCGMKDFGGAVRASKSESGLRIVCNHTASTMRFCGKSVGKTLPLLCCLDLPPASKTTTSCYSLNGL